MLVLSLSPTEHLYRHDAYSSRHCSSMQYSPTGHAYGRCKLHRSPATKQNGHSLPTMHFLLRSNFLCRDSAAKQQLRPSRGPAALGASRRSRCRRQPPQALRRVPCPAPLASSNSSAQFLCPACAAAPPPSSTPTLAPAIAYLFPCSREFERMKKH
jgi:hypothetical protein